jgi:hypothetical protein
MSRLVYNWLTTKDISASSICARFIQAMRESIPGHLPCVCGIVEPFNIPFADESRVCQYWVDQLDWEDHRRGISGGVSHGKYWHSSVLHYYDVLFPTDDDPLGFLKRTSLLFEVDFSYVQPFDTSTPSAEDSLLQGLTSHELQRFLPTIPWACCFGPAYVELITKERLKAVPFYHVEALSDSHMFCQSAGCALECLASDASYHAKREAIKATLGLELFFDPANPTAKKLVPRFQFAASVPPEPGGPTV